MTNLMSKGAAWLCQQRTANASCTVDYRRAAQVVTLSAALGVTHHDIENDVGVVESFTSQDFIIETDALTFESGAFTPQAGDRITLVQGVLTRVFEVLAPAANVDCWKYSDPSGLAVRVHTKEVLP